MTADVVAPELATRRAWRSLAMLTLAGLGLALATYLTALHYGPGLAVCIGVGGCEQVQASRFASVQGIPVAALGLVVYALLLALTLAGRLSRFNSNEVLPLGRFVLSLAGVIYSGYLTYLELFVIGAVCPWCVTSALLITGYCALAAWDMGSHLD